MIRDRRVLRRIWHLLVDDPYRKLVAIGLAVLLWFFIDSRIMNTVDRRLQLTAVASTERGGAERGEFDQLALVLPSDIVARRFLDGEREIDSVQLVLRGPRFRVDALSGQPLNLGIRTFQSREFARSRGDGQAQAIESLEFTAADIFRNLRELQGIEIEMQPTRVRVEYERFASIVVPRPDEAAEFVANGFAPERMRRSTATYSPATVTIQGPAVAIETLEQRDSLFRVEFRGTGNEDRVTGMLEIVEGDALGVRLEVPTAVQVELFPKRDVYDLTLPVFVDDLSLAAVERGRYRPEQSSLAVRVSFSGALGRDVKVLPSARARQAWAEANLRLVVYLPRLEPGTTLQNELDRRPHLALVGPKLHRYLSSDYSLEDSRTVKLNKR
ncbi:MAG: hypothetical protein AB8H80_09440 [Planctomycetota bacterium]